LLALSGVASPRVIEMGCGGEFAAAAAARTKERSLPSPAVAGLRRDSRWGVCYRS